MSSKLKVNNIIPSTGTQIGISTTGGGINLLTGTVVTGIITASGFVNSGDLSITGDSTFTGDINVESDVNITDWIVHTGDTDTKFGFPAVDTFTVQTAGSQRLHITSGGLVGINNGSPATVLDIKSTKASDGLTVTKGSNVAAFLGHNGTGDEGLLHLKDGGTTTIQIYGETGQTSFFNAGKVGIGTNSPSFFTHIQGDGVTNDVLKITARGSGQMVNIQNHSNVPNIVRFANYLGNAFWDVQYNTDNSFTLDYNDAEKFRITSTGIIQCGTSAVLKAEINNAVSGHKFISQCDDNNNGFEIYQQHGSTATRNTLAVYDNRGNSTSKQLAFAVIGNGNVSIGDGNLVVANGHGIDFSATGNGNGTMGNELLDDYEEGSWSPTIYGGTTAGSYSYQANRTGGKYTKIGNMVYIEGVLRIETINSAGAGDLYMGGMPYSTSGPMASAWTIGKGVQFLMYGTSGNSTASIAEPPFVGTASGGASAFNIRSYGKNLNVMPQIEDFDNQWWIFQIAGWYPVS